MDDQPQALPEPESLESLLPATPPLDEQALTDGQLGRLATFRDALDRELDRARQGHRDLLDRFEVERAARREALELELAQAREAADRENEARRASLDEEFERSSARLLSLQKELAAACQERENLLAELPAEVEAERSRRLERMQANLEKARQVAFAELEREKVARQKEYQDQREALRGELDGVREALRSAQEARAAAQREHDRLMLEVKAELEAERASRLAELHSELAGRRQEFEAQTAAWDQARAQEEAEYAQRRRDLDRRDRTIAMLERALLEDRQNLEGRAEQLAAERVAELEGQLRLREERVRNLEADRDRLYEQLKALQDLHRRFGNQSAEEVLRNLSEQEQEIKSLRAELAARPSLADKARLAELQAARTQLETERLQLLEKVARLEAKESSWLLSVSALEEQREQREVAERRRAALAAQTEALESEVERLRSLHEKAKSVEVRRGVIELPLPQFRGRKRSSDAGLDETEWLDGILAECQASGLSFNKRLLYAFHTSLKTAEWSPLTVLAGVSGTGKSELPRNYARFGGLNYLPLAVQPNWDSPQSLFGFFNSIDNCFNATPLLQALVQSQRSPEVGEGFNDRMLLVLLDEMNLSHVELYFSDLLSKLEMRRGEREDIHLEIDLGAGATKYEFPLGRNVLWVGTMNEDETTKSLSDKVYDRSSLISFPRPQHLMRRPQVQLAQEKPLLSRKQWEAWQQLPALRDEDVAGFKDALEEINHCLEKVGRALGHRVWQAVESYIASHPGVIRAHGEGGSALQRARQVAFEDAVVHKVMPKLRGIETEGIARRECLDPISRILQRPELGLNLAQDFDLACMVGQGFFVWSSAHYLEASERG